MTLQLISSLSKTKMKELKDAGVLGKERFKKIAQMWKEINPEKSKTLKNP